MNPLWKLFPWAVIDAISAGIWASTESRTGLIVFLVFSAWWIAANVAHEIWLLRSKPQ